MYILQDNAELLAQESARESGKPVRHVAKEVERAIGFAAAAITRLDSDSGDVLPAGPVGGLRESATHVAFDCPEPVGVVVSILARSGALELAARQLFAAITAGCPIIIKPAEETPLSCLRLVHLLHEAGLPHVWCQCLVTETDAVANSLVVDPRVTLLSFTGSSPVGWRLRQQLPPGTRCVLDHGSVTPVVVAADADLDLLVAALVEGGLQQASAEGDALQRVYAPRKLLNRLIAPLTAAAQALVVQDPLAAESRIGPLVRRAEAQRVHDWVTAAVAGGAQLLCGGERVGACGYQPTLLVDPPIDALVATQPVCAPVIALFGIDADEGVLEAACDRANALPYARSVSVFTRSNDTAIKAFRWLDASSVVLNAHSGTRSELHALSGLRRSGLGAGGFLASVAAMQFRKALVIPVAQLADQDHR